MNTIIESVEELEALPVGSIIEFAYGPGYQDGVAHEVLQEDGTWLTVRDDVMPFFVGQNEDTGEGRKASVRLGYISLVQPVAVS